MCDGDSLAAETVECLEKKTTGTQTIKALAEERLTNAKLPSERPLRKGDVVLLKGVTGVVEWYNVWRRYGFIKCDGSETTDVFIHQADILKSRSWNPCYRTISPGERVEFDVVKGKDGKLRAVNVTGPNGAMVKGHYFFEKAMRMTTSFYRDDRSFQTWLSYMGGRVPFVPRYHSTWQNHARNVISNRDGRDAFNGDGQNASNDHMRRPEADNSNVSHIQCRQYLNVGQIALNAVVRDACPYNVPNYQYAYNPMPNYPNINYPYLPQQDLVWNPANPAANQPVSVLVPNDALAELVTNQLAPAVGFLQPIAGDAGGEAI